MCDQRISKWTHISEVHGCRITPFSAWASSQWTYPYLCSMSSNFGHFSEHRDLYWIRYPYLRAVWLIPRDQSLNSMLCGQHVTNNTSLALKRVIIKVPLLPNLSQKDTLISDLLRSEPCPEKVPFSEYSWSHMVTHYQWMAPPGLQSKSVLSPIENSNVCYFRIQSGVPW